MLLIADPPLQPWGMINNLSIVGEVINFQIQFPFQAALWHSFLVTVEEHMVD